MDLLNQLEALLMVSDAPLATATLLDMLDGLSTPQLNRLIDDLNSRYQPTALEVVQTPSGWRIQVKKQYGPVIARAWPDRPIRLSQALLETLAVVAYHQPVTRGDIEQIRGVSVNAQILRTLFERDWITERGHREVPGRPALLYTTPAFLAAFGLTSIKGLPEVLQAPSLQSALLSGQPAPDRSG